MKITLWDNSRTYSEYHIEGYLDISLAKVPDKIKLGDIFNIYHREGGKSGCEWKGDLHSSLVGFIDNREGERKIKLPRFKDVT